VTARLPPFLEITPRVRVPGSELHLAYAASSGPGGQNVNKVESKAVLRWDVLHSVALSPGDRALVLERLAPRLTTAGELVLACDRHRDQPQNVTAVLERLKDVLRAALHRDPPRKKTKPGRGARERRLSSKKRRSDIKRGRRGGAE
jgi:ribosome-associated protein